MLHFLDPIFLIKTLGLIGVIAIIFAESGLFFGFFFPGDSLLFAAGFLASQGYFSIVYLIGGAIVAAIAGDSIGYAFGKKIGPKIFIREDSFFFHKDHVARTQKFYEKHGSKTIILARFVPIVRTFAPILAGVARMHYSKFLTFNIAGGILWASLLSLLGYFLGNSIPNIDRYMLPIVAAIIVLSLIPLFIEILKNRAKKS